MTAPLARTHALVVAEMLALRANPRRWNALPRVVDLFCGAGGGSWGATLAGCNVVAAVNHWPQAIDAHARALPWAAHHCEDLERLSPMALPWHHIMWASIECTGHTRARGKERLHHDASRATAFCPVRIADYHRPRVVIVENVVDFRGWSMLEGWLTLWRNLGYREDTAAQGAGLGGEFNAREHGLVLCADRFGVPQERERLFFVFSDTRTVARGVDLGGVPDLPRVHARAVVDLDTTRGRWSRWREEYAPDSVARIVDAVARQGSPCLVPYYGSDSSHAGWSLDRPCGTLTRKDRFVVVVGERSRVLDLREQRAIAGFPPDYPLALTRRGKVHRADSVEMLGASVVPVVAEWFIGRAAKAVST